MNFSKTLLHTLSTFDGPAKELGSCTAAKRDDGVEAISFCCGGGGSDEKQHAHAVHGRGRQTKGEGEREGRKETTTDDCYPVNTYGRSHSKPTCAALSDHA